MTAAFKSTSPETPFQSSIDLLSIKSTTFFEQLQGVRVQRQKRHAQSRHKSFQKRIRT